ncbi:transporter, major facilitator family protein [Pelomyxa schiedti]|nr:transporter, major facilitator family protein [Pelomyxa schiedti]
MSNDKVEASLLDRHSPSMASSSDDDEGEHLLREVAASSKNNRGSSGNLSTRSSSYESLGKHTSDTSSSASSRSGSSYCSDGAPRRHQHHSHHEHHHQHHQQPRAKGEGKSPAHGIVTPAEVGDEGEYEVGGAGDADVDGDGDGEEGGRRGMGRKKKKKFWDMALNSCITVYLDFMVMDFVTDDPNLVGYYAGFPDMLWALMQIFSSYPTGHLSDKFGRRPLILFGASVLCLSTLAISFSFSYIWFLAVRTIDGIFTLNFGVVKAYIGDLAPGPMRPNAFALLSFVGALGSMWGSLIGGFTARPAEQYSWVKQDGFLAKFPYFLPNFIISVHLGLAIIYCAIFLRDPPKSAEVLAEPPITSEPLTETMETTETNNLDKEKLESEDEPVPKVSRCRQALTFLQNHRSALSVCLLFAFLGFAMIGCKSALPAWAMATIDVGGLGFDAMEIGIMSFIMSAWALPVQAFLYKPIVSKIGLIRSCQMGLFLFGPTVFGISLASYLTGLDSSWPLWLYVVLFLGFQSLAAQLAMISLNNMVVNSEPQYLTGKASGFSQVLAGVAKAISPIVFLPIFAWSIQTSRPFPFGVHFTFLIILVLCLLVAIYSMVLPKALDMSWEQAHPIPSKSPSPSPPHD